MLLPAIFHQNCQAVLAVASINELNTMDLLYATVIVEIMLANISRGSLSTVTPDQDVLTFTDLMHPRLLAQYPRKFVSSHYHMDIFSSDGN